MPTRLLPPFIAVRAPQSFEAQLGLKLSPDFATRSKAGEGPASKKDEFADGAGGSGESSNDGSYGTAGEEGMDDDPEDDVGDDDDDDDRAQTGSSNYVNVSIPVHMGLYSVVPDLERGEIFFLFEFWWKQVKSLDLQNRVFGPSCHFADRHKCADLRRHMWNPYFGDLRCEFVNRDGRVMPGPKPGLAVHSAELLTSTTFVGSCPMPEAFVEMIEHEAATRTEVARKGLTFANAASSSEKTLPRVRLLREGDPGVEPGVHVESVEGAFQADNHQRCYHMKHFLRGDRSAMDCGSACYQLRNSTSGGCVQWQLISGKCFVSSAFIASRHCQASSLARGGKARALAWDAVATSPADPAHKRLITFGCSMPLFGDGNYMNRIPQWLEYVCVVATRP